MYACRRRTYHSFSILVLALFFVFVPSVGEMFLGSVVFQKEWSDFHASQYRPLVESIESAIRKAYKEDNSFEDVHVTQVRQYKPRKGFASRGLVSAVFSLQFQNETKARISKLYEALSPANLGNMPAFLSSLRVRPRHKPDNRWPGGQYGLPKPATGCPTSSWKEGFRYHDSENFNNGNYKSNGSHFAGEVGAHGIKQQFCIHEQTSGEVKRWPLGQYCIYKKGDRCPIGLEDGWVRWDDENANIDLPNALGGELPEGVYGDNTLIRFCCSTQGNKSSEIALPVGKPFYLIAYGSQECQRVLGYKAFSEFLQFDDEDQGNRNGQGPVSPYGPEEDPFNTRVYYCYYQPVVCNPTKNPFCDSGDDKEQRNDHGSHAVSFAIGSGVAVVLIGSAALAYTARQLLASGFVGY